MRRTILVLLLLGVLCAYSLTVKILVSVTLDAPGDVLEARSEVGNLPELLLVKEAYEDTIKGRFQLLRREQIEEVFGSKLKSDPSDNVLPLFVPVNLHLSAFDYSAIEDGTWSKNLTDFHSFGDIGYLKCFYETGVEDVVLYLRRDDAFVPFNSTNDFRMRLEWEKAKIASLSQWLDQRIPKTDLGVVEVSRTNVAHVDFGSGKTGLMLASVFPKMSETNISYAFVLWTQSTNIDDDVIVSKNIDRTNQAAWFSLFGKFYRMIPKFVGPITGQNN